MNIQIQLAGNLTHDIELRYTASGQAVAQVRLAHTPRRQDPQTQQWVDGEPTFLTGTVWGSTAEHAAESLQRGDRVIVIGTLRTESFADRTNGEKRTVQRATIDEIGPSLRFATAKPQRAARSGGQQPVPAPSDDDAWTSGTSQVAQ